MGLFSWLRGRGAPEATAAPSRPAPAESKAPADEWGPLEPFAGEPPQDEARLAGLIASAIAAGDRPDSKFVVRGVKAVNPEVRLVTVIASAIAAADRPDSEFVVKRVSRRKSA